MGLRAVRFLARNFGGVGSDFMYCFTQGLGTFLEPGRGILEPGWGVLGAWFLGAWRERFGAWRGYFGAWRGVPWSLFSLNYVLDWAPVFEGFRGKNSGQGIVHTASQPGKPAGTYMKLK